MYGFRCVDNWTHILLIDSSFFLIYALVIGDKIFKRLTFSWNSFKIFFIIQLSICYEINPFKSFLKRHFMDNSFFYKLIDVKKHV